MLAQLARMAPLHAISGRDLADRVREQMDRSTAGLAAMRLLTLLAAPWLLRQGQHIRVDILLRAIPARVGWLLEWVGDILGLACSLYFVWYGCKVLAASYQSGAISIKTLVTPEWWLLAPLPVAFALFAIEFVFRMHRLSLAERAPRPDAVSAS